MMDIDEIFAKIGEFGIKQKLYVFFICCGQICVACHMVFMAFAARRVTSYICDDDTKVGDKEKIVVHNETLACDMVWRGSCNIYRLDNEWSSITNEWSLICDESYKGNLAQAVFMGGIMLGSFVWGFFADNWGRLKTIYFSVILIISFSLLTSYANSIGTFILLRFWLGFSLAGHGTTTFVLATELIGVSYRSWLGLLVNGAFAIGIAILVFLSSISNDWRQLSNYITITNVLIFLPYLILPESPHWLLYQNRINDCKVLLARLAHGNGSKFDVMSSSIRLTNSPKVQIKAENSILDVCKYSLTFKWTLIQVFIWFTTSTVYYGLTMAGDSLHDDVHLTVLLSGLVEIPGYCIVANLINKVGRKTLLFYFFTIASISCLSVGVTNSISFLSNWKLFLAMIGKLAVSVIFAIIYVYSIELFPTPIRNAGFGLCMASARLGSVLTPFIALLDKTSPSQQFIVFGCLCFLSAIFIRKLPETKDCPLPETLVDLLVSTLPPAHVKRMKSDI